MCQVHNYGMVKVVSQQLRDADIPASQLTILDHHFGLIKTETLLLDKKDELREIIQLVDDELNSFIKNHEYHDVLGQLYVEFLRYANSDKGLGIVLTPPHITEFFADLAQVNSKSVVYDNCVGTGGFLISAMKRMIQDAKGNTRIEKKIKRSQLFGVELQPHIYPLAVSNMYIHQDGKSNVLLGSCFDADIVRFIKRKQPNVGFLNPPYKTDKKNDIEELEFVLNNLNCLIQGGTCIAIVPMQCALSCGGKIAETKKQIMEKHTLECVFSMPNELFTDSDVSVVSCIMMFTAHYPHPTNKQVYFGYYKDDGFVKRKGKGKGRIDAFGTWNDIKRKWLDGFMNKRNEPGFSTNKAVTFDMEWAAEAYMVTDYSDLANDDFIDAIKHYAVYGFMREKYPDADKSIIPKDAQVCLVELKDIFQVRSGNGLALIDMTIDDDGIPFVSRQDKNNGIAERVKQIDGIVPNPPNTLSVAVAGSVLATFFQPEPYYSAYHVFCLDPIATMTEIEMLLYAKIINSNKYKYNYGRQANKTLRSILIPDRAEVEAICRKLTPPSKDVRAFLSDVWYN